MSDDSLAIALALVLHHTDQLTTVIIDNCKTAPMTTAQAARVYRALMATALIVQTELKATQEIIDHDD